MVAVVFIWIIILLCFFQEPRFVVDCWSTVLGTCLSANIPRSKLCDIYIGMQPTARKVTKMLVYPETLTNSQRAVKNHLGRYISEIRLHWFEKISPVRPSSSWSFTQALWLIIKNVDHINNIQRKTSQNRTTEQVLQREHVMGEHIGKLDPKVQGFIWSCVSYRKLEVSSLLSKVMRMHFWRRNDGSKDVV